MATCTLEAGTTGVFANELKSGSIAKVTWTGGCFAIGDILVVGEDCVYNKNRELANTYCQYTFKSDRGFKAAPLAAGDTVTFTG